MSLWKQISILADETRLRYKSLENSDLTKEEIKNKLEEIDNDYHKRFSEIVGYAKKWGER